MNHKADGSPQALNHFDAIVIGSGIGGLTTASILAQLKNKRILVLERHFKLGGFTHSFRRGKYEWDAGVHYVGQMSPGSLTRRVMDLVTRNGVDWHRMQAPVERFVFPQESFEVPDGAEAFMDKLIVRFPSEEKAIRNYFRDVKRAQGWLARWFTMKQYPAAVANVVNRFGRSLAVMTTNEYLADIQDPLLKAILTAQWPDFGSAPDESAFAFHATVTADFMDGGFYPIGGSKLIAEHAAKAVEDHGGKCLVNHEVEEIILRNGKAVGVRTRNKGKELEYFAPLIISNAGGVTTFGKLLPQGAAPSEQAMVTRLKPGTSANILFLGLNDDPRAHGFDESNYWIYSRLDHDTKARFRDGEPDRLDGCFVSFGSLRNPGQTPHTAQIISFADASEWSAYEEATWKRRGEGYEARKAEVAERMLAYAEERLPGLRQLVDFQELSTPFSVKSFTGHEGGAIYGQACDPNRLERDCWPIVTSVPNLYLTGSDVGTPGVNGALMAGVMTAGKLMGWLGLPRIMTKLFAS